MGHCNNLSPLLEKGNSTFEEFLAQIYPEYYENIATAELTFRDKPIRVFTGLTPDFRHQTFEHLTTKGNYDRLYNQMRCERILWIKDILTRCTNECDNYRVFPDENWKPQRSQKARRYFVWCVMEKYVIILEERQKEVFLITAYCVLYNNKLRQLEREYHAYVSKKQKR